MAAQSNEYWFTKVRKLCALAVEEVSLRQCCASRSVTFREKKESIQVTKEGEQAVDAQYNWIPAIDQTRNWCTRPIRFLCLHGSGSNAVVMRMQLRHLQAEFKNMATFDCIHGGVVWEHRNVHSAPICGISSHVTLSMHVVVRALPRMR